MKEYGTDELFGTVRQAPTELSKQQVMEMITILPTLPPPGNSWFNINLNSIIMTTTTIAIITSAVIYFSSPKADPQLQGQELSEPATTEQAPTGPVTSIQDSLQQTDKLPAPDTSSKKLPTGTVEETEQVASKAPSPRMKQTATPAAGPKPTVIDGNQANRTVPPTLLTVPTPVASTTPAVVNSNTRESLQPVAATKTPRLNELKLKRLKRTLQRELISDYLIQTKRSFMVLQFKEGEIFVNDQRLDYAEYTKYSELLNKFRVDPGPEKRVVIDSKFIMVGDFTDQGFKGASQGKAMNIKFYDNGVMEMNDIFSGADTTQSGSTLFRVPKGKAERGDIYLKTEGRVKDAEANISLLDRMMSNQTNETLFGSDYKQVQNFKNAATIFEKGLEETTIELSTEQIKSFKKELYKNLIQDAQVSNKSEPVVMLLDNGPFKVNNKSPLEGETNSRYQRLLQKYDLSPDTFRRVIMNKDFIMIGDFEDGRFIGTIQGTLNSEAVRGTVIEKALEGYGVFGTSYHLSSKEGLEIGTKLKTSTMKALKETLYQYMVSDGYIVTSGVDVIFNIETAAFQIDEMARLNAKTDQKYRALLSRYKVKTGAGMKILMSRDFLLVGQFRESEFNGSLQGMLEEEHIIGSKFEPLLRGIDINLGDDMTYRINGEEDEAPDMQREEREIAAFDKLEVSGLAVVYFTQGPLTKARLEVSGMPIEDVITQSEDGTLRIYTRGNDINNEQIAVYVSSPKLSAIEVRDAAEFKGQTQIIEKMLKVSSFGAGAVELDVDVDRLHLIMDGGDIDIEGKAVMERTDFLEDANRGTLEQSGLRVLKNWEPDEKSTRVEGGLVNLKEALTQKLLADGFIESWRDEVTISFSTTGLKIGKSPLSADDLASYLKLLKTYKVSLRDERKVFLSRDFIIIADRNNGEFEFKIRGTDLNFKAQETWQELEDDVFDRR